MTRDRTILIRNVFHMLSYAFTTLRQSGYEKMAKEAFEEIHDLFAALLVEGIAQQLKQGLYREYVERHESTLVMRGKIELAGTIQNRMRQKQTLHCAYDELSENNLLNKIVKTTALLLLRHEKVAEPRKRELRKQLLSFGNVGELEPRIINWSSIRLQANNRSYRMLLGICRLTLEGMLMTNGQGTDMLASFVDDQRMSRLYERFIFEYYKRTFPELSVRASRIDWALDDGFDELLPAMRSDVTLSAENTVLIIDAKYYARTTQVYFEKHTIHSQNLYQLFTYVKNKDAALQGRTSTVSGLLLYAKTDEQIQPDHVYQMSGNQISAKTLDLNRPFEEIEYQLCEIVITHFGEKYASVEK